MNCKAITERLKRVTAIVDSWKGGNGVPQIERDIALEELRAVYNELLVMDAEAVAESEEAESDEEIEVEVVIESPTEEENTPTSDVASMEAFYDALDIDALLGLTDEPATAQPSATEMVEETIEEVALKMEAEPEVEAEPAIEAEPEVVAFEDQKSEPTPEPTPEPVAEPSPVAVKPVGAGLFDLNDIPVRSKSKRKMISLYSDNPIPTVADTPKRETKRVESEQVVERDANEVATPMVEATTEVEPVNPVAQQRLGDSFGEVKTLADHIAKDDAPTTPFNRITELRQAIGLNDKFLMIRDLFGGDAERYEATIDTLDEFDDLDECIIYIVENFRWNPDLEAAKLLVSLIERKLA